jgi:hypothetical protein
MSNPESKYLNLFKSREKFFLWIIILVNLGIKLIPSSILELGNDEVYYWTYALFPDWSHFDHPPMVGLTIQLFTLNLTFQSEILIRAGSLVLSSLSILLLFNIVKKLFSVEAAFISILLFTASFYFNIVSGLFILPDTPQVFFILVALSFGLSSIIKKEPSKKDEIRIMLFGLFTGLAFLSKYHSLFLWLGFGIFILLHNRVWLRRPSLYISVLITLITMIPVIYWNIENNFISFTFHESRIGLLHSHLNPVSFIQFNSGQFFYQNPVLFIVYILALISVFRTKTKEIPDLSLLLVYLSVPMIAIFTLFSLFRNTLPHWTGPVFICLIILSSEWLADLYKKREKRVINTLVFSNLLFVIILIAGTIQIRYGVLLPADKNRDPTRLGRNDFTLDMYGWKQSGKEFNMFLEKEGITSIDHNRVKIISNKWFPAAHIDFYMAHPLKIDLIVLSDIEAAHKYKWINKTRHISVSDRVYFITSSQQFFPPVNFGSCFEEIIPKDTLHIHRCGVEVKNLFIYEMKGFKADSANKYIQ